MFYSKIQLISKQVGNALKIQKATISCAESCTGGWISKILTDNAGSSNWFDCGFITYSNKAKEKLLGINKKLLTKFGSVSENTVRAMALAAKYKSGSSYSIAVSGIAGPSGGNIEKPIGTVWFGFVTIDNKVFIMHKQFNGNRDIIRYQSVYFALQIFYEKILIN
ncbi:nicotinamide-nucleotide amidase [Pantoea sp. SoEX]|uniref:nicotinamide-nucleotide amidase n=1 Tax=Pantoea sp. SoEX TaxID=2576763 RepID=UPI00135A0CF8|nr:nicotinamide-nucleotide amidase [Pantoea sp. SoEX]MXP51235.1 nicotinamide-nucleotide amidase [Pantoea sp. SoEX]